MTVESYQNIPQEMRPYVQWIVWKYEQRQGEKPTKVPYSPTTGRKASTTDATTWGTFEQAVAVARNGHFDGLGFVFTEQDPFVGIDLDASADKPPSDLQQFIFNKLNSYAEKSPGGYGAHIIAIGKVPAGRNDQSIGVEVYGKERFFTMTGTRLNGQDVQDRASMVLELWNEIGGVFSGADGAPYEIQNPAVIDDETLIKRIVASGRNNAYYNWTASFDWSEAYRSVLGAACLFSSDEAQVQRVIMASPMVTNAPAHGSETRPNRVRRLWGKEYGYASRQGDVERGDAPYRMWSQKWFPGGSRELYAEVMAQAKANAEAILKANSDRVLEAARQAASVLRAPAERGDNLPVPLKAAGLHTTGDLTTTPPPGVFNDLINEVCARTRNPSDIMAIWSVLGFVSGAVGRVYVTEEGAGVNNFFILSAGSNTGKTQHWTALASIVRQTAPGLLSSVFGGDTSSPQIIAKEGQKKASMVLRLPDAGPWLKGVVDAKTQIQLQMRSALLNIYEAAGAGSEWHIPKSIRAKDDKNESIDEFNMSIALDTTPQYVTDFDLSDFTDGLMSRFIMVYGPETIAPLQQPKRGAGVPQHIATMFDSFTKLSTTNARPTNVNSMAGAMGVPPRIVITHEEGLQDYLWSLEVEITDRIRDIQRQKLPPHYIAASRVVLNAKRVAACVALIENPATPVITRAIYDWSLRFVLSSVTSVIQMFDVGVMGSEESKQEAAIIEYMERKISSNPNAPYVTLSELGKYVDKLAPFAKSKMGARYTRQRVLSDMFDRGILEKITIQTKTKPRQVITFATND